MAPGAVAHLESAIQVGPEKVAVAPEDISGVGAQAEIDAERDGVRRANRDRQALRFTASGVPEGLAFRTHGISSELTPKQRERVIERENEPPELVVIWPRKPFTCVGCSEPGDGFLLMSEPGPLCLACADLDHLVYLPAGDAGLTRRARKASALSAVVVRFSTTRKRYERQGLLVEEAALATEENRSDTEGVPG